MKEQPTLRDQFAMAALTGDWAAQEAEKIGQFTNNCAPVVFDNAAYLYYRMADAMLKARGQQESASPHIVGAPVRVCEYSDVVCNKNCYGGKCKDAP